MELQDIIQFIKRKWQTVAVFALVLAGLAFMASVAMPQKYRAEQRLLLVQSYAEDVDPYAATRSTEYLTNLLTEVMYSEKFLGQVIDTGYGISNDLFPEVPKKRKKFWQKTIATRVIGDTGIIDVSVYHADSYVAEQLALAIGDVLTKQHGDYHSRGRAVVIQTIDQPTVSLKPVQPNIPLTTGAGAVLGVVAGLAFIYLFPNREIRLIVSREPYRLSPARGHDWSTPIAEPVETQAASRSRAPMYDVSELKYPMRASKDRTTGIGYMSAMI